MLTPPAACSRSIAAWRLAVGLPPLASNASPRAKTAISSAALRCCSAAASGSDVAGLATAGRTRRRPRSTPRGSAHLPLRGCLHAERLQSSRRLGGSRRQQVGAAGLGELLAPREHLLAPVASRFHLVKLKQQAVHASKVWPDQRDALVQLYASRWGLEFEGGHARNATIGGAKTKQKRNNSSHTAVFFVLKSHNAQVITAAQRQGTTPTNCS